MKQKCLHKVLATVSIAGLAIGAEFLGCETNPYTHRSQLMLMPESQEMQMGAQAYDQVVHDPKVKISTDPREVEPVKRVADREHVSVQITYAGTVDLMQQLGAADLPYDAVWPESSLCAGCTSRSPRARPCESA